MDTDVYISMFNIINKYINIMFNNSVCAVTVINFCCIDNEKWQTCYPL